MIGQVLLQYRIVEKIGEGGQGTVYRAVDTTLDRPAVVKVLPPELTDSGSNLVRFEREAKLASSLDHPNICTIFGLHTSLIRKPRPRQIVPCQSTRISRKRTRHWVL